MVFSLVFNDDNILNINLLNTIKVSETLDVCIVIRCKLAIIFVVISFSRRRTDDPEIARSSL